jgi:hypothetical protein
MHDFYAHVVASLDVCTGVLGGTHPLGMQAARDKILYGPVARLVPGIRVTAYEKILFEGLDQVDSTCLLTC